MSSATTHDILVDGFDAAKQLRSYASHPQHGLHAGMQLAHEVLLRRIARAPVPVLLRLALLRRMRILFCLLREGYGIAFIARSSCIWKDNACSVSAASHCRHATSASNHLQLPRQRLVGVHYPCNAFQRLPGNVSERLSARKDSLRSRTLPCSNPSIVQI